MNLIEKRVKKIFNEKRVHTARKKILENTINFSKENNIKIIYSNIDFFTIKLLNIQERRKYIENKLYNIYTSDDIQDIKKYYNINHIKNKIVLFDKFLIVYNGLAFSEQKKIYSIYDFDLNKIGQIIFKNDIKIKKNKNVINEIEFKGLFFKSYQKYFDYFLQYFNIDKNINGIVKRVDYCVDFKGIEVFELLEYLKHEHKITKNVNAVPYTDKKLLLNNDLDIKYGKQETYKLFKTAHNDLKVYDKILNIFDKYRNRKINGINPYQDYLDSELPIARIEVKKKKFQNLRNNSINRIQENIESLFFDHLLRYFKLDLSLYVGIDVSLNGKKIYLAKEVKEKSLYHSYIMAQSYLRNIEELIGKDAVYKFLYKLYPDLENIKPLDLVSELDVSDYFTGISDELINLEYINEKK